MKNKKVIFQSEVLIYEYDQRKALFTHQHKARSLFGVKLSLCLKAFKFFC